MTLAPASAPDAPAVQRRRTRLPPDRRREQILAAAAILFRRGGYAAVGVDAIGAAAGISGPAIYRHFGGKHLILSALLRDAVGEAVAAIDRIDGGTEALARTLVRQALDARLVVSLLQTSALPPGSEARREVGRLRSRLVTRATRALRAVRPELPARAARLRIEAAVAIVRLLAVREAPTAADRRSFEKMIAATLDA